MNRNIFLLAGILLGMAIFLGACAPPPLSVDLEISASSLSFERAGDQITLTLTVTNPGTYGFDGVDFAKDREDIHCQMRGVNNSRDEDLEEAVLPVFQTMRPGDSLTCTLVYTVTAEDLQNGGFTYSNTAYGILAPSCGPGDTEDDYA